MGELLFKRFLDEEVTDLQMAILHSGVNGLLHHFEIWLLKNGYLRMEKGEYICEGNKNAR